MAGPRQFPDTLEAQLKALESDEEVQGYVAGREALADDPARPLYHFSPPLHFMNDPNGLCEWQGRYHLFFQYLPGGEQLTPERRQGVCWGHAVSDDLVNWRDMPIALYPDVERDCFSGQTLVEDDRVIALYHGTRAGNGIATAGDPLLLNWQKHPDNPVIPGDPQGLGGGGGDEVVAENGKLPRLRPLHLEGRRRLLLHFRHLHGWRFRRHARRRRPRRGPPLLLEGPGRVDLPRAAGDG